MDDSPRPLSFRIECVYGPLKWVLHRRLFDFVKLHSLLSLSQFRRTLGGQGGRLHLPSFPNQVHYMMDRVRAYPGEQKSRESRIARVNLERRKALQTYLRDLIKIFNMKVSVELCAFRKSQYFFIS